jgi:predicted RNase H-like HicB family nuclease
VLNQTDQLSLSLPGHSCRSWFDVFISRRYTANRGNDSSEGRAVQREFNIIIERDSEGYYVATVPGLRGCHTQAKSLDTLIQRVREAIDLCLETEQELPELSQFVGVQRIMVET